MELVVNGERQTVADGMTITKLLEQLQVQPERVVVEVNLNILKRAQHTTTILRDGDQVEIVHFVGGGQAAASFKLQAARKRKTLKLDAWDLKPFGLRDRHG